MPELTNPLSRPVTAQIRNDHSMVLALFHRLHPKQSASVRRALARRICTALDIHAQLEEEILYPALREAGIEVAEVERSLTAHTEMRDQIDRVLSLAGSEEAQHEALCELMNTVMHHMADEETLLLPQAERVMTSEQLASLCARMRTRRLALAGSHAGEMSADLVRSAPGRSMLALTAMLVGAAWLVARPQVRPRMAMLRAAISPR